MFDRATAVYVLVAILATTIVLCQEWHNPCDAPLRTWLIGNVVCSFLYISFKYLAHNVCAHRRLYILCSWTYGVLSCVSVAWFCVGFIFVLSCKECRETAPNTFRLSVVFSFFELFVLATCFLLLACICLVDMVAPATMQAYMGVGAPRGATRGDLARLRQVKFTSDLFPETGDRTCSICLCDYEEGESIHILPCPGNARHAFHALCVEQWLSRDRTCPVCKHDVTVRSEADERARARSPADPDAVPCPQPELSDDVGRAGVSSESAAAEAAADPARGLAVGATSAAERTHHQGGMAPAQTAQAANAVAVDLWDDVRQEGEAGAAPVNSDIAARQAPLIAPVSDAQASWR